MKHSGTIRQTTAVPDTPDEGTCLIRVAHLTKYFGGNAATTRKLLSQGKTKDDIFRQTGTTVAVNDISFSVRKGEIYVLIGLSGSGKSTVIRCLNGLIKPTSGVILYNGNDIENFSKKEMLDFRRQNISMVFQNFGLMGHRNVLDNVAYGLEVRGMKRVERYEKAMHIIEMVGLAGWEKENIRNLSGGMRQRVGIARALPIIRKYSLWMTVFASTLLYDEFS